MRCLVSVLLVAVALSGASVFACDQQIQKFAFECDIQDRYRAVRAELATDHGINVERIAGYRALRFISRESWEKAQVTQTQPKDVYQPAPKTWDLWEQGERFSKELLAQKGGSVSLSEEDLRDIHRHSITEEIMSKWAVWLKGARPGRIRNSFLQIAPAFQLGCASGMVDEPLGEFLENFDLTDFSGKPLLRTILSPCAGDSNHYSAFVLYLKSERVPRELQRWLDYLNTSWRNTELTPIEFAADVQRWFVAIHPFGDGNGRVSRFVEDMLLYELDLPFVPAGDLRNDLLTPTLDYRLQTKAAIEKMVEFLVSCTEEYRAARSIGAQAVSFACGEI